MIDLPEKKRTPLKEVEVGTKIIFYGVPLSKNRGLIRDMAEKIIKSAEGIPASPEEKSKVFIIKPLSAYDYGP